MKKFKILCLILTAGLVAVLVGCRDHKKNDYPSPDMPSTDERNNNDPLNEGNMTSPDTINQGTLDDTVSNRNRSSNLP